MAERSISVRLTAEVSGYIANMTRAGAATKRAMDVGTTSVARHGRAWQAMGLAAKTGTVAVAGGLALAVKEAADFNAKMALVQTLSHANQREMAQLRRAAMGVGTAYGYTASQVADGEAEMIKAGVSLRDIMGGGLRGTLALAAAGQLDVADATSIAASAMTQFQLKGRDIPHVADLLAAGADKALGSVQDLGYGLEQSGTTAHQMGLSIEQTTGTLAAFAQAGLIGERGGTTFKQMLLQLASPTSKAADLMHQYGLSLYQANGQIKTMPELAGSLQHAFEHLTPAQRNAALGTIFGSRAIQGANILMAQGRDGIAKWIAKVNDQGFAAQQAGGKLNSLEGDLQKLKAVGENALISLGQGAQGPLRGMVQGATAELHKLEQDGSLRRWGRESGKAIGDVIDAAKQLGPEVGSALHSVGVGIKDVVDGFRSLPHGVQQAIVTGGVVATVAHKTGADTLAKSVLARGAGTSLGGRGVVPVFVTNPGFAGNKPGAPGVPGAPGEEGTPTKTRGSRTRNAGRQAAESGMNLAYAASVVGPIMAGADQLVSGIGSHLHLTPPKQGSPGDINNDRNTYERTYDALNDLAKAMGGIKTTRFGGQVEDFNKLDESLSHIAAVKPGRAMDILRNAAHEAHVPVKALTDLLPFTAGWLNQTHKGGIAGAEGLRRLLGPTAEIGAQMKRTGLSATEYGHALQSLPKAVQTKVTTPGAVKSIGDVEDLQRKYHLTPKQVATVALLTGAAKSRADVMKLAHEYHLTPKQVTTLLQAIDHASGPSKKAQAAADKVKGPRVATLLAHDAASAVVRAAEGVLAGFNGRHATATITTVHQDITRHQSVTIPGITKPRAAPGVNSATGNLFRAYADGDVPNGHQAVLDRQPRYRMWAEPETKGEAYIPLADDWRRPRAVAIWEETGHLLGQYSPGDIAAMAAGGPVVTCRAASIEDTIDSINRLKERLR